MKNCEKLEIFKISQKFEFSLQRFSFHSPVDSVEFVNPTDSAGFDFCLYLILSIWSILSILFEWIDF